MSRKIRKFESTKISFLQYFLLYLTMSKNNNLLLKIGFITVCIFLLSLWIFFIIENESLGLSLGTYFTILMGSSLRKFYIKLFEEDIFTQYLYLFVLISLIVFAFILNKNHKIEKNRKMVTEKFFIKNKINEMLDTCNYYEAKLYENDLLFKYKKDNSEYLASKDRKTYARFELLKNNPKYDYLVRSFIKCPRESSELVYIFDSEGTLSVILKLKDTDSTRLENLKFYLQQFETDIN